jgi:O-methyltransferase
VTPTERYIKLLGECVTRAIFPDTEAPLQLRRGSWQRALFWPMSRLLALKGYRIYTTVPWDPERRRGGFDWPAQAETMIGLERLANVRNCLTTVIRDGVLGDVIETGVWRGGTCIFMKGVLDAFGEKRTVWVADSFEGVPRPDPARYPADAAEVRPEGFWKFDQLAVSLETVQHNFRRYGLLDDRVKFLKGWFKDTLPVAPIGPLALMRLDGDLYESTMDALQALYPKLVPGGYCLVDDYGGIPACAKAVDDYRMRHGITEPIERVDTTGIFWRRRR